ncbi:sigma factor-like helix-turn-helix DNA-binding protein [Streptomyces lateritius]|uniref:Sigma factor-like helix-turn-helix DNA-binding protein n=1 Tax=Streptomyces lateritius TaxID=67313 RepID=A0ABW6Y9Y3_9ACTN
MSRSTADSASAVSLPTPKERRRLREAKALSEEQVAETLGVTRATVRSWETGRTEPRGRKRETYARLLSGDEEELTCSAAKPAPAGARPSPSPEDAEPTPAPEPTGAPAPPPTPSEPEVTAPEAGPSPVTPGRPGPTRPAVSGASTRPRAAAKRAAKPPKGAAPSPGPAPAPQASQPPQPPQGRLRPEPPAEDGPSPQSPRTTLTPEEAFDALYAYAAPALVHQTYLLTGRRRLSREAVEHAFHHAWQHWPEVAVDRDPAGWVRAAAYEYALSPWHRLRRAHRHPDAPPTEAGRRALLAALLELPPPYRRTVLLYDGLGLDLPDTAAETEASTPAAAHRLMHARTVIAERVPGLAHPDALHRRLAALVSEAPTATLAEARTVRTRSERRARLWTRAALAVTAGLIGVTAFTAATAPTSYVPVHAPGQTVNGVPVRGGSQQLTPEDRGLREMLRSRPHPGPERLVPAPQ